MTQELYQNALLFAGEKHAEQCVPGTKANYLLHISNVTMEVMIAHTKSPNFNLDMAIQMAILHDTIEDTETTFNELITNFGESIANGVLALTKNNNLSSKKERMMDSLQRILMQPNEVGIVKLADRITNLQKPPKHWDSNKISLYYQESIHISETLSNKNEYLNQRLLDKISNYKRFLR